MKAQGLKQMEVPVLAYWITNGPLRVYPQDRGMVKVLIKNPRNPIFAIYWAARKYQRPLLVVGQFRTYHELFDRAQWSMVASFLPAHFERFEGVWKRNVSGIWECEAGVLRIMPAEVCEALFLRR